VRGKVKVGEKSAAGYPTSTDYFVCDDPEFVALYDRPTEIRVALPYAEAANCFVTTLEAWKGSVLACRSNDGKVAYRKTDEDVGDGTERFAVDQDPREITCLHQNCPWFLQDKNGCKTHGRLRFFLADGTNRSAVLEFGTKGYGSIEGIAAAIGLAGRMGDCTLATGTLRVEMRQKGNKRFPVVSLELDGQQASSVDEADEVERILVQIQATPEIRAWVAKVGYEAALVSLRKHPEYRP
jgi:hypothetical protein